MPSTPASTNARILIVLVVLGFLATIAWTVSIMLAGEAPRTTFTILLTIANTLTQTAALTALAAWFVQRGKIAERVERLEVTTIERVAQLEEKLDKQAEQLARIEGDMASVSAALEAGRTLQAVVDGRTPGPRIPAR